VNKKIFIKRIGEITLYKSKKARRISIRVKPAEGVMVSVPTCVEYDKAIEFVYKKADWIGRQLKRTKKIEAKQTLFTRDIKYSTRFHRLVISAWGKEVIKIKISDGIISVNYPEGMDDKDLILQKNIKEGIVLALRKEAKEFLPKRVEEFALKNGFKVNRVYIKNSKTLWGSCSSNNNINLNLHVMRLPERLMDYIIFHELVHTIYKNHGKEFWTLLTKLTGNGKVLAKELKNYDIQVF
jgi:predicted metal-dependent hydrolase